MAQAVNAVAVLGETERARDWAERAVLLDPYNMNMRYNLVHPGGDGRAVVRGVRADLTSGELTAGQDRQLC